jgi:hypothetical protein
MFPDGKINPRDIVQGNLSNTYFTTCLAALVEKDE